jgi:hypothetical protein
MHKMTPCYYWLLLWGGVVQSVPYNAAIFCSIVRSHLSSKSSRFIRGFLVAAETPSSKAGSWRYMPMNLADEVSLSYSQGFLTCRIKFYDMESTTSLPLRRKLCCGFLSTLKIHRPRPGLNPRAVGRMANTTSTRPPRTTYTDILTWRIPPQICSLLPYCNRLYIYRCYVIQFVIFVPHILPFVIITAVSSEVNSVTVITPTLAYFIPRKLMTFKTQFKSMLS